MQHTFNTHHWPEGTSAQRQLIRVDPSQSSDLLFSWRLHTGAQQIHDTYSMSRRPEWLM